MVRKKPSDFPQKPPDLFSEHRHGRIDRRSFLDHARRFALGGMALSAVCEMMRPNYAWAQQVKEIHPASARVLDQLRTRFTFQISVDVATLPQGLAVASAALAGGVDMVEMGTPLLKNEGVSNVVPAFRKQFPKALLLADMKTMDGGASEARGVYAGGGNIIDFLALAGVDTAKAVCSVRDEFRRSGSELPRLAFADIMLPQQGPAAQAAESALRMLDAGVDVIGVHLQSDARHADPKLIESDVLGDTARAIFERVGKAAPVEVVGGLTAARAKSLARAGLRCFVISGNLGQADGIARYNLPPAQIERLVAGFIAEVSSTK
jgi:3-hexulose-6-phosphate synthase